MELNSAINQVLTILKHVPHARVTKTNKVLICTNISLVQKAKAKINNAENTINMLKLCTAEGQKES